MEAYAKALSYAVPGFILLMIIEAVAAKILGRQINRGMDLIASMSSGMTNTLKSFLGLGVTILAYREMEARIGIFDIQATPLLYVLAFIGHDFAGYWSHRFNHSVNLFWNRHVVHHSSEDFNLACALRQEISVFVKMYFFLYIPIALLGVPYEVVAIVAPIQFFAQFWYHTRLIGRMGFLEHILVTPSHHRVHHAINEVYLDRNLSQIFIIWDKLFGTFQEELEEEPCIYGTLTPANSWNPLVINFSHAWRLAKDSWHAGSWWDAIRIWFMPLGWRPVDVIENYPRDVPPVYGREKYDPDASTLLKCWAWFRFVLCNVLLYHMLICFGELPPGSVPWYCVFLFASVLAYTSLMDRHWLAVPLELIRVALGYVIIVQFGGWFGLDNYVPNATGLMQTYLAVSLVLSVLFTVTEKVPVAAP